MLTTAGPAQLLEICQAIEVRMGRTAAGIRWGPRVIDLDILLYEQLVCQSSQLRIPHARMHERLFVLIPLAELAPRIRHPLLNKTIAWLRNELLRSTRSDESSQICRKYAASE